MQRCHWSETSDEMRAYHDTFWGTPIHDDQALFAKLILDMNQAGLSWATILKKTANFYEAYANFDIQQVAAFDQEKFLELMNNPGIIRNRLKVQAAIVNAQKVIEIQAEFGSFDSYIWSFTNGKVEQHHIVTEQDIPTRNDLSDRMSKDMKRRGMKFIGTTTIYAYLQAIGVINDHAQACFRYAALLD
ncbi:DNA-3-methyladenine glycosylase I [Weissella muntiaci]|uniref:DNA-3-methyladenine glycosylase I n=1 Tax=Weissella muntiaci TaxID=2508881 RepID=A0A6C2C8V5_9LACO|nr:DNA-3-methyladenine glycosylase I [Weissella muntiaci]TYC50082.1 DNA-3-methyladenine glycosylase I [Weissella muntiaci]